MQALKGPFLNSKLPGRPKGSVDEEEEEKEECLRDDEERIAQAFKWEWISQGLWRSDCTERMEGKARGKEIGGRDETSVI